MAYFNDTNNASFHPVSDVPGELGFYPFAEQTSGTEEVGMLDNSAFSDRWSMVGQPEPVACSPTNLWDTASGYDQVASATSYSSWDNGYGQPLYPDYHLPGAIQQTRYCHPGFSGWDVPLADVAVPEILAVAPIPSSAPFDHWWADQSRLSTGASQVGYYGVQWPLRNTFETFTQENVPTFYPSSAGPTRTESLPAGRFQPYGTSRARLNNYGNAEAGPSALVLPPVPYVDQPTLQPSGGTSEATADADQTKHVTEEDRATKPKRRRLPHGQGKPRPSLVLTRGDGHKLCDWVERQEKLLHTPSLNQALNSAVKIIRTIRKPEYPEHRLKPGKSYRTKKGKKTADDECDRRTVERELYRELSRYYRLEPGQEEWTRPPLLRKVLKDLRGLTALPE